MFKRVIRRLYFIPLVLAFIILVMYTTPAIAQEEKEDKTESDEAPPQEPPVQASLEDEAQKEGAWDTMTLLLVGLAVVALLIYLFR